MPLNKNIVSISFLMLIALIGFSQDRIFIKGGMIKADSLVMFDQYVEFTNLKEPSKRVRISKFKIYKIKRENGEILRFPDSSPFVKSEESHNNESLPDSIVSNVVLSIKPGLFNTKYYSHASLIDKQKFYAYMKSDPEIWKQYKSARNISSFANVLGFVSGFAIGRKIRCKYCVKDEIFYGSIGTAILSIIISSSMDRKMKDAVKQFNINGSKGYLGFNEIGLGLYVRLD